MLKEKNFFEAIWSWIKKIKYILITALLILAATFIYLEFFNNKSNGVEEYKVVARKLSEGISLTGRVQASNEANLSFEKTGIVRTVNVITGQKVLKGEVLATLSGDDALARVQEAQANLLSQKALLEDLTTGARSETVDNKKAAVNKAENDLNQAYKNAGDSIKNAAISGNSYVRDNLATAFSGNLANGYRINVNTCDSSMENMVSNLRGDAERALIEIEKTNSDFPLYENDVNKQNELLKNIKNIHIKKITEYLDALKGLYSLQCVTSNSTYDTTRTLVTTSRTTWSAIATDLSLKSNLIDTAKTVLEQSKNDLRISETGEKGEKVKQQEANVNAAVARLTQANAESNKNILRAPFGGIITNVDVKLGELVSPGGKSISLISQNNFEIESKVSEVDVAKLINGAKAEITFDTYGDSEKFEAVVSNISPAGIISEGVPTYKTIFTFVNQDERIRSGMTANINVVTSIKENVLSVPAKFIVNEKGVKKVLIKNGSESESKIVKTGISGSNGEVEILEGLSENDVVIAEKK